MAADADARVLAPVALVVVSTGQVKVHPANYPRLASTTKGVVAVHDYPNLT